MQAMFQKFLTNMQAMFTGFKDNDEILTDTQKIRLLFQKIQSPSLTQVKNALQVLYGLDKAGEVTYDFLANSMAAEAANLPDHASNRQASGVDRHPAPGSAPASGILHQILQEFSGRRRFSTSKSSSTSTPRRVMVRRARLVPSK
jgi:hypothetical protein